MYYHKSSLLGCSECGTVGEHYSYCSQRYAPYASAYDAYKISQVKTWVNVNNPIFGTCRHCGHRGLVDDPCIGLY